MEADSHTAAETGIDTPLTRHAGIRVPLICGAMYPCSNPELVAAVSLAGGIGIVQPLSLTYVHGYDFREGLRHIRSLAEGAPIGFNALIEKSVKAYEDRMRAWVDIALEEGVRFFVTAMGHPRWVAEKVHAVGGVVYHDVTERRWALKALEAGVDGLITVNDRAGGHAGAKSPAALLEELADLGVPLVCAGGIGDAAEFAHILRMGYAGAQLGTRFIATTECSAHDDYKQKILDAGSDDIVLTDKLSGVPVSVIRTPWVEAVGTRSGPLARRLLRGRRTKHWMRTFYALRSLRHLKKSLNRDSAYQQYYQAGKSVQGIERIEAVSDIVRRFEEAAMARDGGS